MADPRSFDVQYIRCGRAGYNGVIGEGPRVGSRLCVLATTIPQARHARTCSAHPRVLSAAQEHVDRRNKSGDDDQGVNETKRRLADAACRLEPDSRVTSPVMTSLKSGCCEETDEP
jgi:hypothetical protein